MKNLITSLLKNSALIVLLFNGIQTHAQKLPTVQTGSVKAPENIKIDGKATEWSKFEAYNNATEIFYTISNDDKNIYLAVQAPEHYSIAKVVTGGITFTIKNNDKNSQIIPFAITYPYYMEDRQGTWNRPRSVSYDLRSNPILSESQRSILNNQISGLVKEIPLTGAKGISDASISIYNELGIKANGFVDDKKAYTCEIAIPLKYVQQVIDANGKFSYRLQVNGRDTSGKNGTIIVGGVSTDPSAAPSDPNSGNYMLSPTYLDGTYTLAK